jgi:hypothetical protein
MQPPIVFLIFLWMTGSNLAADSAFVEGMVAELTAKDSNVRHRAVESLYDKLDRERGCLPVFLRHRASLESYLQRWHGDSSVKAALLLGLMGDKQAAMTLRKIKTECAEIERKADPMDDRNSYAPAVRLACLKALLRLGDDTALDEVRSLLRSNHVEDRVKGIRCVSYAECADLVSDVVPLLNDKRDAVNIEPSSHTSYTYFVRVCDLAVNTLADLRKLKTSFELLRPPYGERYCDEKIAEVRRKVLAVSAP